MKPDFDQRRVLREAAQVRRDLRKASKAERVKVARAITREGQTRAKRQRDPAYLAWVRRLPCLAGAVEGGCDGPIEAAHVRFSDARWGSRCGMGRKPDDRRAVPLCRFHHQHDQHAGSERRFYERLGVDAVALCQALSAAFDAGRDGAAVLRSETPA